MRYKKGQLYKIRFYDHSIGMKDVMVCETVGWLLENNKDNIVLSHWIVDTDDKDIKDHNVEYVSVIKTCILKADRL